MNDLISDLLRGAIIGVSIAAPVGPIGILCIRRTLASGMAAGFCTGLGAAVADAVYAAIGALGITAVTTWLIGNGTPLRAAGIGLLLWIAWSTWRSPARDPNESNDAGASSLLGAFAQTFALTMANPMTIISFAAIFAGSGLGMAKAVGLDHAAALVCGAFVGSLAWWLILSGSVAHLRGRITPGTLGLINKLSALILLGFAAWMASELLANWR
ncbi:MAG: LysE family transporter [Rhodospirillaceae bacterium]|nr:LysE family transporter [Rhodospirillaceae bacterium]